MNRRTLATLLIVLSLLALASSWLSFESSEKQRRQQQSSLQSPDYYLQQAEIVTMAASGQPEQRLTADYLAHFPLQQYVELRAAQITLLQAGQERWNLRAGQARIELSDERIYLQQQVRLQQLRAGGEASLTLDTAHLTLYPEIRFIETDAPLQLSHPQGSLRATGLQAYLDQERIELLSEVRLNYEP